MKGYWLILLVGSILSMNSCNMFNQNDFIESGKIVGVDDKEMIYNLYQTGHDNYRYEIRLIENQDTLGLFTSYLNDATARNTRFTIQEEGKAVIIKMNKPVADQEKKVNLSTFYLKGISTK